MNIMKRIKDFAFLPKVCVKCGRLFCWERHTRYWVYDVKNKKGRELYICKNCWEYPKD